MSTYSNDPCPAPVRQLKLICWGLRQGAPKLSAKLGGFGETLDLCIF